MVKEYITIKKMAEILGVSRIAVYKRVKAGKIKATLTGNTYLIPQEEAAFITGEELQVADKKEIDSAVKKTVEEYGAVLKLLGKE